MFYIVDAGRRISTPVAQLLRPLRVEPSAGVTPIHAGSPSAANSYRQIAGDSSSDTARRREPLQRAADLMRTPCCAHPTDSVAQAWQILLRERFHHLPVVDVTGRLCGIISDRDLLRLAALHPDEETSARPVQSIMQVRVVVAAPAADLRSLAEVMVGRRIGAVPVVDPDDKPIGIVTRTDLLRALVLQAPLDLWG